MTTYGAAYRTPPIIGIAGIIASGKTSLCKRIAEKLGWDMIPEPVTTNPYLPLFYKDMDRYSFTMQIYLLNRRFKQHQAMVWSGHPSVQDRTIYEDPIFALMLARTGRMSALDFDTYALSYTNMTNFLHKPDLIIYLDVTPETALARLTQRGRECEKGLPLQYLRDLREGYEDWLRDTSSALPPTLRLGSVPVLRLDWNSPTSTEEVINLIEKQLGRKLTKPAEEQEDEDGEKKKK